jgi:hypothetical protein
MKTHMFRNERSSKRVLMSSLPLCLALVSANLSAQESFVSGASETEADEVRLTSPNDLVTRTVHIPSNDVGGTNWHCAVTASAEAINPLSGDNNRYVFGLNVDDANSTRSGSDRTIDFDNLNGDETNLIVVSSTYYFSNLIENADHTFYWSARKQDAGDANMIVDDMSLTVTCSDYAG